MARLKEVRNGQDFKVKVVSSETKADLLVYLTDKSQEQKGKDEIWQLVKNQQDKKIRFVNSGSDIDIYYVDRKNKAKWKKSHQLRGRIG